MPKKTANTDKDGRREVQRKVEQAIVRPYSYDKPIRGHKSFNWVQDAETGEWVHAYNDPKFIRKTVGDRLIDNMDLVAQGKKRVVDFAGGEGLVGDVLHDALKRRGHNATVINLDLSERNLHSHKKRTKGKSSTPLLADAMQHPIKNRSLDGAVMRYGLHYFPKGSQEELLRSIASSLKKGAPLVIYHPDHRETLVPHVKAMSAASGIDYKERIRANYFPTKAELRKMAQNAGYEIIEEPTVVAEHWYSAESYADRWGGDDRTKRSEIKSAVAEIFEKASKQKKYAGKFRANRGRLIKPGHHVVMTLRKK